VAELVPRLLPEARRGLVEAGVDAGEADRLLGVLGDRVAAGQTGAVWQRRTLAALEGRTGREQALSPLLERYLELQAGGDPVHTWPVEAEGPAQRAGPSPCPGTGYGLATLTSPAPYASPFGIRGPPRWQ
jgi:hypothetical protein